MTPSHLSNIENGKYELSYKMRKQLCRLLEEFNLSREQGGAWIESSSFKINCYRIKKVIEEFFPGDEIIEVTYTNIDDYNEVFAVFVDSEEIIGENGSSYIAMLRQNLRANYKICLADELDSLELDLITHPFKVVDNTPDSLHSYLQK